MERSKKEPHLARGLLTGKEEWDFLSLCTAPADPMSSMTVSGVTVTHTFEVGSLELMGAMVYSEPLALRLASTCCLPACSTSVHREVPQRPW